jgi:hypothetical protein
MNDVMKGLSVYWMSRLMRKLNSSNQIFVI